ncbi:MAG TPA: winged helix-turn-helix domain-containing protein [Sphingomicrobium sp.]
MDRPISLEARRIDLRIELPFRLGRLRVDPPAHEYAIDGVAARIQPQTLKVLVALHDKLGQVVTRDELVDRCWDGRIVGEDVINRCISLLRRFEANEGGFRIETVPRAGYRLVEIERSAVGPAKREWVAAVVVLALLLGGVAGWAWLDRRPVSQGRPPTPSISIMPFVAEANDPLARQVAQAAPVSISHMMAESGFAIIRDDPAAPSNDSRSDYLFSGHVRRTAASLEATVQLVSKADGAVIYTHEFRAPIGSAADLPDRIGAAIAAELAWTGAEMVLDPREHLTPEIASELMDSISLTIEGHDRLRAYQLAHHAAEEAPDSAIAQLTLTVHTAFALGAIPQSERDGALALARKTSERARALAPEFGDVYLTWCQLHSPVRLTECDARVRHAMQVDPSSSFVPGYLSTLLYEAGRIEESTQLAQQSIANDPYKPAKMARMIRMLEASGRSDDAGQLYLQAVRLWPDEAGRMREDRLLGMGERGNYAGLAAFADPADAPMIGPREFTALLSAQRRHDLAGAKRACGEPGVTHFTSTLCMTILADLGDLDGSFAIAKDLYPLWQAPPGGDEDRFWLNHLGGFDTALIDAPAARSMRSDPRFLEIARKQGLIAYWRKNGLPDFCTEAHEPVCARIAALRG